MAFIATSTFTRALRFFYIYTILAVLNLLNSQGRCWFLLAGRIRIMLLTIQLLLYDKDDNKLLI